MAARADVFLSNFRESALERLGLGYETLKELNPRLVYACANGFGPIGPIAGKKMFDGAAAARSGLLNVTGPAGGPPNLPGAVVTDTTGARELALAIMTALLARERFGKGQKVNTSAFGAQIWSQRWEITHVSMTGHAATRMGGHLAILPGMYGVYETSDKGAIFIADGIVGPEPEETWKRLCQFGGMSELGVNTRFNSGYKRSGGKDEEAANTIFRQLLRTLFGSRTQLEWEAFLQGEPNIIWESVKTYADVLADPQASANGYITDIEVPGIEGPVKTTGNTVHLSTTPGSTKRIPPLVGEHTEEVLADAGFSTAEIRNVIEQTQEILEHRLGPKIASRILERNRPAIARAARL